MHNFKMICKMYREIAGLDKGILPVDFFCAILTGAKPFVNIWFTAKIIGMMTAGADFKGLLAYILAAVALNFVLDYAGGFLSDLYHVKSELLFNRENFKMAEKLFRMDYEKLEDNTFRKTIHKHEEAGASRWARFSYFMWTSQVFVKGVFTVAVSVVMILPLLKIGFTKTGNSFFERPVFLILLIATLVVMAAVMALIAVRMNKSYLAATEAYATLDRLFYSLIDLFADYKTGKEIRLYKEQHLIGKIATEKILTDGEKTLKQISMRTAKTSSIVAVMGAFVAFGVYVFIGVKGNLGLFDIGALVVYGINQDGSIGEERRVEHHQEPNGRMSHIHASMPTPDGKYIAVADCGLDYIYLYDAKTYQKVFEWKAPEDSGPRQLRFSPDGKYLYMVSELSCQIFVFEYQPDCKDMLRNVQVISTRREDGYDGENYTSDLEMHPSGRYLMAGNRGHNSIVVYEVDKETGLLMLKGHTMLAGDFCREFCFVPDGSMLIVGIQHTDVVQTFFFDENKGILKWSGQEIVIPSPSCVIMGDSAK